MPDDAANRAVAVAAISRDDFAVVVLGAEAAKSGLCVDNRQRDDGEARSQ
jgi:hypothetical protein